MPKSKVSAFFSVLLVFASGIAMGAVGYRLYVVKTTPVQASKKKMSPEELRELRKVFVNRLRDAVKLDDQQVAQVRKIYEDEGEWFGQAKKKADLEVDQIRRELAHERDQRHDASVAKIKSFLRPDQQALYDKYRAAHDRKRRQDQQQQQGQGPNNGDGHRPLP